MHEERISANDRVVGLVGDANPTVISVISLAGSRVLELSGEWRAQRQFLGTRSAYLISLDKL